MKQKKYFVVKGWTLIGIYSVLKEIKEIKEIIEWGLLILQGQDILQFFM